MVGKGPGQLAAGQRGPRVTFSLSSALKRPADDLKMHRAVIERSRTKGMRLGNPASYASLGYSVDQLDCPSPIENFQRTAASRRQELILLDVVWSNVRHKGISTWEVDALNGSWVTSADESQIYRSLLSSHLYNHVGLWENFSSSVDCGRNHYQGRKRRDLQDIPTQIELRGMTSIIIINK